MKKKKEKEPSRYYENHYYMTNQSPIWHESCKMKTYVCCAANWQTDGYFSKLKFIDFTARINLQRLWKCGYREILAKATLLTTLHKARCTQCKWVMLAAMQFVDQLQLSLKISYMQYIYLLWMHPSCTDSAHLHIEWRCSKIYRTMSKHVEMHGLWHCHYSFFSFYCNKKYTES